MVDIVDSNTRSRMMRAIGPADTAPELAVRRYLHACGLRFRLHEKGLPGRPDIVFASARVAIFVHGCFWHRHAGCRFATTPASNRDFWEEKFHKNVARDASKATSLEQSGWTVLVLWECESLDIAKLDQLYWFVRARNI